MVNIKEVFDPIKPKYVDGSIPLFIWKDYLYYRPDSTVSILNVTPFDVVGDSPCLKVFDSHKDTPIYEWLDIPGDVEDFLPSGYKSLNMADLLITKEMFDFCNSIVSCGLSPLDLGTIKCRNGVLEIRYFNLEYSISATFNIPNKILIIDSYINFNLIWYIYVFYREYSTKKEPFIIKFTNTSNGYILNYNTFYVVFNKTKTPMKLVDNLTIQYKKILSDNEKVKCDTLTKKFISDNNTTIYKNVLKCFGDDVCMIRKLLYDIVKSDNMNAIIAKVSE
jgi:hypothetical protein